jgi:hypothetical protein
VTNSIWAIVPEAGNHTSIFTVAPNVVKSTLYVAQHEHGGGCQNSDTDPREIFGLLGKASEIVGDVLRGLGE